MLNQKSIKKDILILNQPYIVTDDPFYFQLFRIPEILNRLKQYREVLNENDITIPLWVYNLTQDLKILTEGRQSFILDFLVNLGFFDRYISHSGWPQYIIGSDPLISVLVGEISFEEQALLLSHGYCQNSSKNQLYQVSSYYNTHTGSFYLNSLKKMPVGHTVKEFLEYLKTYLKQDWGEWFFQMLSPHEEEFMNGLKSKGIFVKDFLESDSSLKWLWPSWKKIQLQSFKTEIVSGQPLNDWLFAISFSFRLGRPFHLIIF